MYTTVQSINRGCNITLKTEVNVGLTTALPPRCHSCLYWRLPWPRRWWGALHRSLSKTCEVKEGQTETEYENVWHEKKQKRKKKKDEKEERFNISPAMFFPNFLKYDHVKTIWCVTLELVNVFVITLGGCDHTYFTVWFLVYKPNIFKLFRILESTLKEGDWK